MGGVLWAAGTLLVRLAGHRLLDPGFGGFRTALTYAASFGAMYLLVPHLCARAGLGNRQEWFKAAALLMLPTLTLDAVSCVLFAQVFPNVDAAAAGAFGGWMMICCAGAIFGVWTKQ
jgi:hypothetical protein